MTIAKTKVTIMKMANPFQNRSEDSVFDDDFEVILKLLLRGGRTADKCSEPLYKLPAWKKNDNHYLLLHDLLEFSDGNSI